MGATSKLNLVYTLLSMGPKSMGGMRFGRHGNETANKMTIASLSLSFSCLITASKIDR